MSMKPIVSARYCGAGADDAQIQAALFEMLDGIDGLAESFGAMKRITVKSNLGIKDVRLRKGRQIALADASVVTAAVAWLRARTDAVIVLGDASTGVRCEEVAEAVGLTEPLERLGVQIVDYNDGPYVPFETPGGGLMFREYLMSEEMASADAVVSIAKMKSHLSTGATLSLKNLFGIPPTSVYGCPRRYLHAPIRLPRVIADLGLILRPALCVIDGVVGQTRAEWNAEAVEPGWLVAGNNTIAVDAVGMRLMGFDPLGDYPDSPFHFDRNPVKLAAERGLGPAEMSGIDLRGDAVAEADGFFADRNNEPELLDEIRRSIADQAALFEENRGDFVRRFPNQFIGLYDGEVAHAGESLDNMKSRGEIARERGKRNKGLFLKKAVPLPEELETYSVYESILEGARA